MPVKVSKISMQGFRGATAAIEIPLDTAKPVILIFGENGTGKSTLADAFDFVCNCRFGSLEDRSLSGQPKTHVSALGQSSKDLRVLLSTSNGNFTATLTQSGISVSPTTGCPDARILRRSSVLQLLNAQPKQRFEALKSFITVPGIEKSENALRDACRTVERSLDDAVRACTQAKTELDKFWTAEGKPGKGSLQWAQAEANKDIAVLENATRLIDGIDTALLNTETSLSSIDLSLHDLALAQADQTSKDDEQEKVEAKQPQVDAAFLRLLQDAKSFIARRKPTQCPVCEQEIAADRLVIRIDARMSGMSELSTALTAASNAKRSVEGKQAVVAQSRKNLLQQMMQLVSVLQASSMNEVRALNIPGRISRNFSVLSRLQKNSNTKPASFGK
jgi:hypothetical protein